MADYELRHLDGGRRSGSNHSPTPSLTDVSAIHPGRHGYVSQHLLLPDKEEGLDEGTPWQQGAQD